MYNTYSVDVADSCWWEVIVNDNIHPLEVNAPAHQVCADQDPDLKPETRNRMGMSTPHMCTKLHVILLY